MNNNGQRGREGERKVRPEVAQGWGRRSWAFWWQYYAIILYTTIINLNTIVTLLNYSKKLIKIYPLFGGSPQFPGLTSSSVLKDHSWQSGECNVFNTLED